MLLGSIWTWGLNPTLPAQVGKQSKFSRTFHKQERLDRDSFFCIPFFVLAFWLFFDCCSMVFSCFFFHVFSFPCLFYLFFLALLAFQFFLGFASFLIFFPLFCHHQLTQHGTYSWTDTMFSFVGRCALSAEPLPGLFKKNNNFRFGMQPDLEQTAQAVHTPAKCCLALDIQRSQVLQIPSWLSNHTKVCCNHKQQVSHWHSMFQSDAKTKQCRLSNHRKSRKRKEEQLPTDPWVCPRPTPAGLFEGVLAPRVSKPHTRCVF